jgi:hypothetical protein
MSAWCSKVPGFFPSAVMYIEVRGVYYAGYRIFGPLPCCRDECMVFTMLVTEVPWQDYVCALQECSVHIVFFRCRGVFPGGGLDVCAVAFF